MDLAVTTPQLLQHLAQLGRRYDAQALKRFAAPKRQALVAAFLVETRKTLLDQVVTMHDQYMTGLERRSRLAFEDKRRRLRRRARSGIDTLLATSSRLPGARRSALRAAAPSVHYGTWRWRLPSATPCARATCSYPQAAATCRSGTWSWASGSGPRQRKTPTPGCSSHPAPRTHSRACAAASPRPRVRRRRASPQPVGPRPGWGTPATAGRRAADHPGRAQSPERHRRQPAPSAHRRHAAPGGPLDRADPCADTAGRIAIRLCLLPWSRTAPTWASLP